MNKTIIININSIVFHIEEDAYETLRSYMIEIKKHFGNSEDSIEILQDIENRIAEMFSERIHSGKKEVISMQDVEDIISVMGRVSDFENADDILEDHNQASSKPQERTIIFEKKLLRNPEDKLIGGVCSGLGYYFGMEAKWMRIIFVLFFLFGGSGVLLYVVLWIVMPEASSISDRMEMRGEVPNIQNFKKNFDEGMLTINEGFSKTKKFVSKNASVMEDKASSAFRVIGRVIGFVSLFITGIIIVGMFITWAGFASGILGYQDKMVFPGTEIFSNGEGLLALTAGVLAITIPFIVFFYFLVRVLFRTKPMSSYLSLTLWGGWVASIIAVVAFVFLGIAEFKEESTIKIEKTIDPLNVYYFTERDVRVVHASTTENGEKNFELKINEDNLSSYLKRDINIRFEKIDSLAQPFIQYNYHAKGRTYKEATQRASEIDYLAQMDNGKFLFDSHFTLDKSGLDRDQEVDVVIYLPIGSKIIVNKSLGKKLSLGSYHNCEMEGFRYMDEMHWIMTNNGLLCVGDRFEVKKDVEEKSPISETEVE